MTSIFNAFFYLLVFLSVYVQVFFFVTFLENRKKIIIRKGKVELGLYPQVTIAIPCFNEASTVERTVESLLNLHYPENKLSIFIIDDGSTDHTLEVINKFAGHPRIQIFHKKNGGKHTALNLALQNLQTEFFGCLDADSFADPESLVRIMSYFEKDPTAMAVVPSVTVSAPTNMVQNAQKAEYNMGIYFKKMLGFFGAINVTPGPLTIFRKEVFEALGPYRHGHNAEDMEIAYRMQKNTYKIEHCNDAYVYTNTPLTIKKLYRQRLRWIYGFINNTIDYREVLFKKKYGNFALFTLPMGLISIFSVSYLFGRIAYTVGHFIYMKILVFRVVGFNFSHSHNFFPTFDPFFINTQFVMFLIVITYMFVIFSVLFGEKMVQGKWSFSLGMIYYFPIYTVVAPFWLLKAIYNTIIQRKPDWR